MGACPQLRHDGACVCVELWRAYGRLIASLQGTYVGLECICVCVNVCAGVCSMLAVHVCMESAHLAFLHFRILQSPMVEC